MDSNLSLRRICLGDDVIVILSDKAEGSGDWNSLEYQDTAVSKGKNVMNALSFYKMEIDEIRREYMKKVDRGITMIDHTQAEAMGKLSNVLCQVGVTRIIAKFLILDIPIDRDTPIVVGRGFLRMMGSLLNTSKRIFSTFDGVCHQTFRAARFNVLRTTESDCDDEEEYVIKRNKFREPIYGPRPVAYLNCANLEDLSSAIQAVTNPFRKIVLDEAV
ncbi:hypothetical protein Tco_0537398 [Tanacetum coccineum]